LESAFGEALGEGLASALGEAFGEALASAFGEALASAGIVKSEKRAEKKLRYLDDCPPRSIQQIITSV
jgi:hypothetical protein